MTDDFTITSTISDILRAARVPVLLARIKQLEDALREVVENEPCTDPDCCARARRCETARVKAAAALSPKTPEDVEGTPV